MVNPTALCTRLWICCFLSLVHAHIVALPIRLDSPPLFRYKKAADWELLSDLVQQNPSLPLIGNGDILTHYEAADRWQRAGFSALMVGRGALIKPWIFQEIREVGAGKRYVDVGVWGGEGVFARLERG